SLGGRGLLGRFALGGRGLGRLGLGGRGRRLGRLYPLLGHNRLGDGLLRGGALGVDRRGLTVAVGPVEQLALDSDLRPGGAALADAGALTDPAAQVIELGATHVTARGDLDAL